MNSREVNYVPLPDTSTSGNPNLPNISRKVAIDALDVVDFMQTISGHLENASTTMRNIWPCKGPAKSTWIRNHGFVGIGHNASGALTGTEAAVAYALHSRTSLVMSMSIFGQYTYKTACECLHSHHSWVTSVQLLEYSFL